MSEYLIKEVWTIHLFGIANKEYYENEKRNLKEVKKYIKDWIEGWKDNAEENEYKFSFDTDYKTYAKCKIKTNEAVDTFKLIVIKKPSKE